MKNATKGKKNARTLPLILRQYLDLVYLGIRQAYLVDCCLITSIGELKQLIPTHLHQTVIILQLDSEFLIANREILLSKLSDSYNTMLLQLDTTPPVIQLLDKTTQDNIIDSLISRLHPLPWCSKQLLSISLSSEEFCLPFVIGWVLGYPVVYYFTSSLSSLMEANPLSMQELEKVRIHGVYAGKEIDIMEFSYPVLVCEKAAVRQAAEAIRVHCAEHSESMRDVNITTSRFSLATLIF